jgi:hypothetical protein
MRTPRLAGMGIGLMATATLALAGCAEEAPGPGKPPVPSASASSSPSAADPAAASALSAAAAKLGTTSFKITMTAGPGFSLNGLMDAPNGVGTGSLELKGSNATIKVDSLLVGQDLYVRVPGVTTGDTWTHVDVKRLPEGANVGLRPGQIDPANTARLLTATTNVQQTSSLSYRGTLDLTKAAGVTGIDQVTVDGWGAAAHNVPFTAGLDEQGRLSALTVDLPAMAGQQAQPLEILYSDYGKTVVAEKPAANKVTEAPESLYTTLGG